MTEEEAVLEKVAENTRIVQEKFSLIAELAEYTKDHCLLLDNEKANKLLDVFEKEILEEFCEACGGAMCDSEHCPVGKYHLTIKKLKKHGD